MYNNKMYPIQAKPAAQSLTAAANVANFLIGAKCLVKRISFQVKTTVVSTGAVVITVYKRPTPGSAGGQSVLGTLSIPAAAVAPNVYYKDLAGTSFQPGDELAFDVTTAAAGGGAAGDGYAIPEEIEESPEVAANLSNHIASA